ncbi:MAG TPA: bifunctional 5,10-methylenetetrahydrofolate dehydrogenase/5,10-methenyltetrahydrofolate cyclohydrolase [Candidatus Saccharibacteria bacterium]|nr:bifunctional 5,10-methylenetetrahydrofolate dehydrogenase/5,10-methenyltetrahydrofolate cyclohydrolase [Candidatus Saccharibacteria bacterium]HRQ07303.1 bifunctional 5,10-methylenetetrahydrofolate dehydrogenase/5,10-methenyltetrahydrofolate cyclohydrolase [Candidatus Saccharibacteria bacterium]
MKLLDGSELVGYIKERQAKQVRALRQSWRVIPRLAIIKTGDNPVIDVYMRLKKHYGDDILVEVDIYTPDGADLLAQIQTLNQDESVHGIIIQLPLADVGQTEVAVNAVDPNKDVDGLGDNAKFTPATAMAIDWLLAGYNVELEGKKIAIVGEGRLVGAPLAKLWRGADFDVSVYDDQTTDLGGAVRLADIIVTATGVPGLITSEMVGLDTVIIDAGTASEQGKIVGDVSSEVRERQDITITPIKGGVGPLTVAALFDNVITAARKVADSKGQQDL